jgi:hypothetical protein
LYIKTLTRQEHIAFIGVVQYFSGSLLMLLPKNGNVDLEKYATFLNSKKVRNQIQSSKRIIINLKYLSNLPVFYTLPNRQPKLYNNLFSKNYE